MLKALSANTLSSPEKDVEWLFSSFLLEEEGTPAPYPEFEQKKTIFMNRGRLYVTACGDFSHERWMDASI